ncbi:AMP-binding protein [Streptomyces palmae]|uniref:Acetate--CoA ligase n=1 Tax=Streptomyces palmae TaxID=1701085 RepID=A0A4Z0H0A7_9ACTN|nr:AMP-binding protein [Streptomyces palmae]TGB03391.1 acetate--CoA ligase [Streptomyces palmae]
MQTDSVRTNINVARTARTDRLHTLGATTRQIRRVALRWISEPDRTEELTHGELLDQAACAAEALVRLGVRAGDRVAVHLPLVPESVIATLACGRIDAVRCSMPVGLRAHELREHLRESGARVLITADGDLRAGETRALKALADRAVEGCPEVRNVLVVHRVSRPVPWTPGRDLWWHEALGGNGPVASCGHTSRGPVGGARTLEV